MEIKDDILKGFEEPGAKAGLEAMHQEHIRITEELNLAIAEVEAIQARLKAHEDSMLQLMLDSGIDKITGGGFHTVVDSFEKYNVLKQNREELYDWLEAVGLGDIIKINEKSVHAGTLSSTIKEFVAEHGDDRLPEIFKHVMITSARLKKDQSRRK